MKAKKILLETKHLKYTYPTGEKALNGVDIKIYQGERLAILGSNGAGKSTFFLNLNGVLVPEEGEILYRGMKIGCSKMDLEELRAHTGIVFQDADTQIIAPTVEKEVSFGPMNLDIELDEVRERVEEALVKMEISEFRKRPPHYLSGGEKKRVTIADIIAMRPEIFIFDEPTAALDPLGAQMLEETLKTLTHDDVTIVISTHLVDFAWRWADRIVVFDRGKIVAEGDPLKIFRDRRLLKETRLSQPVLISITEALIRAGIFPESVDFPRDLHEFRKIVKRTTGEK